VILKKPYQLGWLSSFALFIRKEDRGRIIPLTNLWEDFDRLLSDIKKYTMANDGFASDEKYGVD
jgi:hypothetical protein